MKKSLIILISFFLANFSLAETVNRWDCIRLKNIERIVTSLYSDKLHLQALTNLKKFCYGNNNVLESPYYINQYLDVSFRYLDWFKPNSDPQAKQRRNFLNNIARKDYTNIDEKKIIEKYQKYWIEKKWSLFNKYLNICKQIPALNKTIEEEATKWNKANIIGYYEAQCQRLAYLRQLQETLLAQTILYKIHYQTIQSKLFKIVNQDFLKKRDNLYNQFVISLWDFMFLVRRFIKSTDANTK